MTRMMRLVCILTVFAAPSAFAEKGDGKVLNLWISHHFAGIENYYTGDYNDAVKVFEAAAVEAHKKYRTAETHENLGIAATALGQFEQAEEHFRTALAMRRDSLGNKHPQVASILNNLADLLYLEGRAEETDSLYREALDLLERDQFSLEVARSLNGLALLSNDAGDTVKAEEMLKRALAIHEKGQRRDHAFAATVATNLGILYTHLGRYEEAGPMFERAKYIQDVKLREGHPDVAVRLQATAFLLNRMGQGAEAGQLAVESDSIRAEQAAKGDLY